MSNIVVLITGANRGIGRGLVSAYLAGSGNVVIAGVRNVLDPTSSSLQDLRKGPDSTLITAQMDMADEQSIVAAIKSLKISKLDLVVANAGINQNFEFLADLNSSALRRHVQVNAYAPLWLFQQTSPLLRESTTPKFVSISTIAGSITTLDETGKLNIGAYASSKALCNYFVKRLSVEVKDIAIWLIHPGVVKTELSDVVSRHVPLPEMITVEECVRGIKRVIDTASMETSGQFLDYNGANMPW